MKGLIITLIYKGIEILHLIGGESSSVPIILANESCVEWRKISHTHKVAFGIKGFVKQIPIAGDELNAQVSSRL